ncbi:hypothetical protein GCM10027402_09880 [Arthrobacter monumenti]
MGNWCRQEQIERNRPIRADDMQNPSPQHQNALTLEEYESLTSARAEFVDFLLGAATSAADDGGTAVERGTATDPRHDGGAE